MGERIKGIWFELRRRKIFKVVIAYAAVGWVLTEVSSVVFPALLLPEWAIRLVVIIFLLGFPLTIVLTWVFDITPHGIERTPDLVPSDTGTNGMRSASGLNMPPLIDESVASVAVLPFEDHSPEGGQGMLANGIATEIHSTLSKLHRIRLAPRRSAFHFAHGDATVEDIARELNVRYVLSGSLIRYDGRLRVIAELDDAVEGAEIWSKKYEQNFEDLLDLQAEIAESIVAAFGGERQRAEIRRARATPTASLDAWSLVQKARHYILDYSRQSLDDAIALLKESVVLDPGYAAAHAALGSVLAERILNGFSDEPERDGERAIDAIKRAQSLAPRDAFVLKMSGMVWATCGDPERSIRALRACIELAPFDFGAWGYLGWPLVARGTADDLDEVHRIIDRLLRLAPDHPGVPYWLFHKSSAYACQDELDKSADFVRQAIEKDGEQSWVWLHYANVCGLLGDVAAVERGVQRAAQLNEAMTPAHYASRIRAMGSSPTTEHKRLDGLIQAELPRV